MTGTLPPAVVTAWQQALAAEQRAVFGYGVLGPHLTGDDRARASAYEAGHEQVRDATAAAIAATGRTPVSALADYPDLFPVDDASAALKLGADLEQTAARAWRYLYAAASAGRGRDTTLRAAAQRGLTASTVRHVRWRARIDPARATTPFPGI